MPTHRIVFKPDPENFKAKISWDLLDEDLKVSAMSFLNRYKGSDKPVAVWKILKAVKKDGLCMIDGQEFSGKAFSLIQDGQDVAVYVASCGDLDDNQYSDPLDSFFSETLKRMACEQSLDFCTDIVSKTFNSKVCSINPGSGDSDLWPIDQLKGLFDVLSSENFPVKILPSGLMFPVKSVAGILFAHESGFRSCKFCSRKNCPDRLFD